jgi:hypothetical protein
MSRTPASQRRISVVALAQDKGWIGQALRQIPDELLREADRRAEQDACSQTRHHDPNRLPFSDPWQSLLDITPDASPLLKKICRSAQSQIVAFRHVSHLAMGIATSNTDWHHECLAARAAGDKGRSNHAARKTANSLSRFSAAEEFRKEWVQSNPALQKIRAADAANWLKQRRTVLIHRQRRSEAETFKPLPRWRDIQVQFPLEALLTILWVRIRTDGPPGLMFWGNEALRKLVLTLRRRDPMQFCNLGRDFIKNFRQNLGLIPVGDFDCMISDIEINAPQNRGWLVKGMERNGNLVFQEHFRPR